MNAILLAYLGSAMRDGATEGVRRWFEDLVHEDDGVRDAVRDYVLKVGGDAVPCLLGLLEHESPSAQNWAASLLIEIGEPALPALQRADRAAASESLRQNARRVLRRMRCA